MKKCGIVDFEAALGKSSECQLVDVREPAEFESERIEGVLSLPLSMLNEGTVKILKKEKPVYLLCRSGNRASQAAVKLEKLGFSEVHVMEGGLQAWIGAGKTVCCGTSNIWSLDRQVRFAAGLLVMTGVILAIFAHPFWLALCAFVAAGLMFSGITDTCGMAMLLAKMPWNQKKS
ncbi:MAG: rhodanese-like domain-containing protein [Candidatus Omnitrophica bacterium]|nr:rhodanese-like domain-containing protein [Candidatus Omnitrophota bacterium]